MEGNLRISVNPPTNAERQFAEGDQGPDPMDVDHPEPAGPPVPRGPPVGPRPAAPVAGRPGVRARRSAHVDPPVSQPRMASEKREHASTPERAGNIPSEL